MTELRWRIATALQEGKERLVERVNGLKDTQELKDLVVDVLLNHASCYNISLFVAVAVVFKQNFLYIFITKIKWQILFSDDKQDKRNDNFPTTYDDKCSTRQKIQ